jgi:hypothetical protein
LPCRILIVAGQYCGTALQYFPESNSTFPFSMPYRIKKKQKSLFLYTAQLLRKTDLADIFSESRSGTIAHKNKKRITAVTHSTLWFACLARFFPS